MKQKELPFTWADRKGWIAAANLPAGKANDGSPVSAASMAAVLYKINDHLGENPTAWPSQTTIARSMKRSTKTVQRAAQALERMSLLIIENDRFSRGRCNYYRVVWTELELLAGSSAEPRPAARGADIPARGADSLTRGADILSAGDRTVCPTNTKEKTKENTTTTAPEPAREPDHEPERSAAPNAVTQTMETSQTWEVVVSELAGMKMKAPRQAVQAARSRGMSPEQARRLMELYRERSKRTDASTDGKRITVGWLYRWLTGESDPEPEPETEPANVENFGRGDALKPNQIAAEALRVRIVRAGRAAGATPEQIESRLAAAGV